MSKEREFLKKLRYASLLENDLRKELEELLAQPEQEPVGVVRIIGGYPDNSERVVEWVRPYKYLKDGDRLYTAPPKREQGLREDLREGISFCDHFAGLAMQELMAADVRVIWDNESIAELAYDMADAMLMERSKRDEQR